MPLRAKPLKKHNKSKIYFRFVRMKTVKFLNKLNNSKSARNLRRKAYKLDLYFRKKDSKKKPQNFVIYSITVLFLVLLIICMFGSCMILFNEFHHFLPVKRAKNFL